MDSLGDLKDKLAKFRIKELKDALTKLGLPKQGTKKVLFDRILAIFYDDQGMCAKKTVIAKEKVVNIVDDIYRKMHVYGTPASKPLGFSHDSTVKLNDEIEDYNKTYRIQCPCGNTVQTESMIKCEDPKCHVRQHIRCVVIPEKDVESGIPTTLHKTFYCELCRLSRLDPFWESVSNPLLPVKLTITDIPPDGTSPVQSIEKTFQLTRAETDLVEKQEYDIQAWCMLLNDKVQFRMHWPLHTSLQLNGVPVRVINRPGSQLLGANGRDDGPIITTCIREGINKISMAGIDARVFCFGVRVVKKRTVQQILNCIPKESDGERFEDALARACRVGGGDVAENADSDSDLQIVDDFISVNLRCPMSGSRIKVAGRFQPCTHKGCFDLEVFVEINRRSRKWQCPICLKNYSLEHIIIDPYLNRITSKLKNCAENVMEIEVKHDGSWRVKAGGDLGSLGDLVQWHLPNGNLCTSSDAESDKPNPEILKSQDGCSNGHGNLRVGLKKNPNGVWQISKPEEIIAMSSSSDTVIGKEGCDDVSVNQDYSGIENEPVQLGNGELIVLSDSDEENELLMIPGNEVPTYSFQKNGIPDSYGNEDHPTFPDSRIGILNTTTTTIDSNNEFGIETWPSPHNIQRLVPGFQIFNSNADVQHNPISGCGFPTDMGSVGAVTESSVVYANANINSSLVVNNPFSFGDVDPSLQMFIPNIPSDTSSMADPNMRDQPLDATTCAPSEDWFSLSLGSGGDIGATSDSTGANGLNSVSVNDNKSNKTCREGPGSPFAFPRKRRSARPRPYPNIDYFEST